MLERFLEIRVNLHSCGVQLIASFLSLFIGLLECCTTAIQASTSTARFRTLSRRWGTARQNLDLPSALRATGPML